MAKPAGFLAQIVTLGLSISACMGPDDNTPKNVDYFSGTWESNFGGGKIRLTYLPENRFRVQFKIFTPADDSVFSDLIYRYRVQQDSAIIEETLDSVVKHPFPLELGSVWHLYYKPLGDTLLLGSAMPPVVDWISQDAHAKQELSGVWNAPRFGTLSMDIRPDSTGTYGGQSGRFQISRDLFIFQETSEPIGGMAFYYEIKGGSMRTWRAKYDCSSTACMVDGLLYLIKIQ